MFMAIGLPNGIISCLLTYRKLTLKQFMTKVLPWTTVSALLMEQFVPYQNQESFPRATKEIGDVCTEAINQRAVYNGHKRVHALKGAMSPHTHARANESKLDKVGVSFSSSVGDFGRLFLSV